MITDLRWNIVILCSIFLFASGLAAQAPTAKEKLDNRVTLADYMEFGHRNAKWDKLVRNALERQLLHDDLVGARNRWEEAYDLGCRDPELLYRLGHCCLATGARNKAEEYWLLAAERYSENRHTRINAAKPDMALGEFYSNSKDYERALEHYQKVNARDEIQETLSLLEKNNANYREIENLKKRFEEAPSPTLARQISIKYWNLSKEHERGLWLDKALALDPEHAPSLVDRMFTYDALADLDKAEALSARTIAAAEKWENPRYLPFAHAATAEVLLTSHFYNPGTQTPTARGKKAHQHALTAVELAEKCGDDWAKTKAYKVLAMSYWSWAGGGRSDLSITVLLKALKIAEKNGWSDEIRRITSDIARCYAWLDNDAEARNWYARIGKRHYDHEDRESVAYAQKYYRKYRKNTEKFERNLAAMRSERARRNWSHYHIMSTTYTPYIGACLRLNRLEEAFIAAERAQAASFLDLLGNKELKRRAELKTGDTERASQLAGKIAALEERATGLRETGREEELASVQRDLTVHGQLLETVQAKIALSNAELEAAQKVDPLTLREIQELLGEATLLEYCGFIGGAGQLDGNFIAIVTKDDFHLVQDLDLQLYRLRRWAKAFRDAGNECAGKASPSADWDAASRDLYNRIFKPAERHIKTKQIIIVPYGALNLIPFACLKDDKGLYLAERYAFSYAPSGSALKFCQGKRKPDMRKALILADPDLADPGARLKFAEMEAEAVGNLFPEKLILRGSSATEGAFAELSSDFDVLHLACHGVMDSSDAMLSNLRLARDDDNDGLLHVREIFDLDLNASLVTLSACNTGIGEVAASGFEFMGMPRAFLFAGTPSVLGSLWRVDDKATSELMEIFYKNLRTMGRAEALQQAQLTMMKEYDNPYYWGAFVLYGDYR